MPSYPCPRADSIRNSFQSVPAWTKHLNDNVDLKSRLDAVLGTAGMSAWSSWCKLAVLAEFPLKEPQTITSSMSSRRAFATTTLYPATRKLALVLPPKMQQKYLKSVSWKVSFYEFIYG